MTHRLSASTRAIAAATAATAVLAIADLVDTTASAWALLGIVLLGLGVIAMMRLAEAAIEIRDDVVIVRNVTRTREFARADVVAFEAGTWNSRVVLADGTVVLSLLREKDVPAGLDVSRPTLTLVGASESQVPVAV